jgi:hypothetical protein
MSDQVNTPRWQDADQYREDLNPTPGAGVNDGSLAGHPEKADDVRSAADVKAAQRSLPGFTDAELKELTILPVGTRLLQGATYIDLRDPNRQEFRARADMVAGRDNWYVAKSEVDYVLWNRLIGVDNPARLDQAGEP